MVGAATVLTILPTMNHPWLFHTGTNAHSLGRVKVYMAPKSVPCGFFIALASKLHNVNHNNQHVKGPLLSIGG
jgi:hypothetical protein